jgi:hypothetical protein
MAVADRLSAAVDGEAAVEVLAEAAALVVEALVDLVVADLVAEERAVVGDGTSRF